MKHAIETLAAAQRNYVVGLRRHFHAHPELGGRETATHDRIMAELRAMGLTPRTVAGTGVTADIECGKPGKTVAIRADMDALPIQEESTKCYASKVDGIMHACGHDGHVAMLLGTTKALVELKNELSGRVRLIFQPMEEILPGGALGMIAGGVLEDVDVIIGAHLWADSGVGTMGISYGRLMAAPDQFTITVHGRGGHGASPHQTVDSLLVAAQIVTALQTVVSRSIDPLEPAVLTVGSLVAGDAYNVIPASAVLKGTVRSFDVQVRDLVFARMEQIVSGICAAAGAEYALDKLLGSPPVINRPEVAKVFAEAAADTLGPASVKEIKPVMGGEDFSHYLQKVPGAFLFVGSSNPAKGIVYPHHHPRFDIDEDALSHGVRVMALTAVRLLEG